MLQACYVFILGIHYDSIAVGSNRPVKFRQAGSVEYYNRRGRRHEQGGWRQENAQEHPPGWLDAGTWRASHPCETDHTCMTTRQRSTAKE